MNLLEMIEYKLKFDFIFNVFVLKKKLICLNKPFGRCDIFNCVESNTVGL